MNISTCLVPVLATLSGLLLSQPALADVLDVGGPTPDAAQISTAIGMAVEGDVLRVWPGTYSGFSINGLSLSVLPAQPGGSFNVSGRVSITNLALGQSVELHGARVSAQVISGARSTLSLRSSLGSIRISDCTFRTSRSSSDLFGWAGEVTSCQDVSMTDSSFRGASTFFTQLPKDGDDGLRINSSRVALYRSSFTAGIGSDATCLIGSFDSGSGGTALTLRGSGKLFMSLCMTQWGWAGYTCGGLSGSNGFGVYAGGSASYDIRIQNSDIGGSNFFNAASTPTFLPGSARRLTGPVLVAETDTLDLRFHGAPGDRVGLFFGTAYAHQVLPVGGPILVAHPTGLNRPMWRYMGVIGANGTLDASVALRDIPLLAHIKLHLVGTMISTTGRSFTNSLSPIVLDSAW